MSGKVIIRNGRFYREMPDGTLKRIIAPRSTGLASPTFAATGGNKTSGDAP